MCSEEEYMKKACRNGGAEMETRHTLTAYALEETARPGAREIRAKQAPDGMQIRHARGNGHEKRTNG